MVESDGTRINAYRLAAALLGVSYQEVVDFKSNLVDQECAALHKRIREQILAVQTVNGLFLICFFFVLVSSSRR